MFSSESSFVIEGVDRLIYSARRTLSLEIRPDAALWVRAPRHLPEQVIRSFVRTRGPWIERKRRQIRERIRTEPPAPRFEDGNMFWFLGRQYPLRISDKNLSGIAWNDEAFFLAAASLSDAKRLFEIWYRNRARRILAERTAQMAAKAGLACRSVRVNGARTRWGSCGPDGTINYAWRLILAPLEVIDYVIAHELAHLSVRDHSPRFWNRVAELYPTHAEARLWLRRHPRLSAWAD